MPSAPLTQAPAAAARTIPCRLCGADAAHGFDLTILRRHPVRFYRCTRCASLETEPPHWLDEAYADGRPVRDVWMAGRTERARVLVLLTLRLLGMSGATLIDWGGGNGLLVRMLRDAGIDAYLADKYASNYYAVGFEAAQGQRAGVMTAFEVFEHADDPRQLMTEMTAHAPEVILLSTDLYAGEDAGWSYLHPDSGKHVFFYTRAGMQLLAREFGYHCLPTQSYTLMHRQPLPRWQAFLLGQLLTRFRSTKVRRLLCAAHVLADPLPGPQRDYAALRARGVV